MRLKHLRLFLLYSSFGIGFYALLALDDRLDMRSSQWASILLALSSQTVASSGLFSVTYTQLAHPFCSLFLGIGSNGRLTLGDGLFFLFP